MSTQKLFDAAFRQVAETGDVSDDLTGALVAAVDQANLEALHGRPAYDKQKQPGYQSGVFTNSI